MRLNSFSLFAKELLSPFIHLLVYFEGLSTARMLSDDNLGTAFVEGCDMELLLNALSPSSAPKLIP
jgi:hypothetical protein